MIDLSGLLEQLNAQAQDWAGALLSVTVMLQAGALALALLIAWVTQFIVRRTPDGLKRRLHDVPAGAKVVRVLNDVRLPLASWIMAGLTLGIFQNLGLAAGVLQWFIPLIAIWFYYRLLGGIVSASMRASQAAFWRYQVLRPVMLLIAALHATGLLDNVLNWRLITPGENLRITVGTLFSGIVIVVLFIVVSRFTRTYLEEQFLPKADIEPALTQAISNIASYTIIVIGVLVALNTIGIPLTMLTVIAGGLSVGIGFGLQEIVNNFISGFILMFERSIGPGDVVEVGNTAGIVQSVGIRSVMIKTRDNISLIVPNSRFLSDIVTNYTKSERVVRVHIEIGVSYSADPYEVRTTLLEAAEHPLVLAKPAPTARLEGFGESSLIFSLLVWTEDVHRLPGLRSDLRFQIWDALKAHDIQIPFPQRDIHIRSGLHDVASYGAEPGSSTMDKETDDMAEYPRAVLWDLDGTIFDSADEHYAAWRETLGREGVDFGREQFEATFGQRNDTILRDVFGDDMDVERMHRISVAKEERYRQVLHDEGAALLPGVQQWLDYLREAGWRQAVASSAPRDNITTALETLGIGNYFAARVSAEDVDNGKPAPDVFLLAADRLDVPAANCIVVEDSPAGIEAGQRAGMATIAVRTTHDDLAADIVVDSLDDLGDNAFERLLLQEGKR